MTLRWRQMTPSDLDAVERIAGVVHPAFFERREVLAEKQRFYPMGAWLCERDGAACGYFLTHPWHADAIPPLDALLGAIPEDAGTYYFHDLALLPDARGAGAAKAAVATALAHATADGFGTASLVAVNGSQRFWAQQGFTVKAVPHLVPMLAAYEPGARYMTRPLHDQRRDRPGSGHSPPLIPPHKGRVSTDSLGPFTPSLRRGGYRSLVRRSGS